MVQYLKTIGEEIGPDLQSLAGSLQDMLMPHRKYEDALKAALANDPSLIGKLATVDKDNPGALDRIFGPNARSILGHPNESPADQLTRNKSNASISAMGDPSISRDAALRDLTGQTDAQRRSSEAGATSDELTLEHKQSIKAAIDHVRQTNPEVYAKLSEIGALREYTGTDENTETIKKDAAQEAAASMEARSRVASIIGMDSKKLYEKWKKGEVSAEDLGSAFSDPRGQGLKMFWEMQMRNEHDEFMLRKQANMEEARDRRQNNALGAAEQRQQERLDAEIAKKAEADKKVQERFIAMNNVNINRFIAGVQGKDGKRMSDEQITASLPQVNDMLQRNQVLKGGTAEEAPQFVAQKTGGMWGFGQHNTPVLMNPDGTPNADYNKETKTTTAPAPSSKPAAKAEPKGNESIYKTLTGTPKSIVDIARQNNMSRNDVVNHPSYKALNTDEKNKVIQSLGF